VFESDSRALFWNVAGEVLCLSVTVEVLFWDMIVEAALLCDSTGFVLE
jgi:hypothetical protein